MTDLLPIREDVRSEHETLAHWVALDSERNVVVVPEKEESAIVARLRDAMIAGWKRVPRGT